MYITVDDIKNEISFDYPIDDRNGNKKVGLIRAYFVFSFYNVENDEKIHLKNGETLKVTRGCYTMKNIEKISSGKVKYNSLTGKLVIDSTISQFNPYMKKILGINNENYIDTLLSKKYFHLKLTNYQPLMTYLMASQAIYCILAALIKIYHLVISFSLSQRISNIKKPVNGVIDQFKISLIDGNGNEISSNFKISIVLHVV